MVGKGIRGGFSHAMHINEKASYKYMKEYDQSTESLYPMYSDVNNLHGQAMQRKLSNGETIHLTSTKTSYKTG